MIIVMFSISILAGMFAFSIEIIGEQEGLLCLLAVLFFPVTMVMGIGRGFSEIFCDVVPDVSREFCEMVTSSATGICEL